MDFVQYFIASPPKVWPVSNNFEDRDPLSTNRLAQIKVRDFVHFVVQLLWKLIRTNCKEGTQKEEPMLFWASFYFVATQGEGLCMLLQMLSSLPHQTITNRWTTDNMAISLNLAQHLCHLPWLSSRSVCQESGDLRGWRRGDATDDGLPERRQEGRKQHDDDDELKSSRARSTGRGTRSGTGSVGKKAEEKGREEGRKEGIV